VKFIFGRWSFAEPMAKPTSKSWFHLLIYWEEELMLMENWLSGKAK